MRADQNAHARRLRRICHRDRVNQWNGDKPDRLLLIYVAALVERRRERRRGFPGNSATALVRAAIRLAAFRAGRIRKDARSGGELERPPQHGQHDRQQDRCCLPHRSHLPQGAGRVDLAAGGCLQNRDEADLLHNLLASTWFISLNVSKTHP
jgi:hypothetical protein